MTGRPGRPGALFDHVDHPGNAKAIHDFAEAVGPEGFLPGHLNAPADSQRVEPALAFSDIAGIEDEGEAGVVHIGPEGAVAQHQLAIIDAQAGVGDSIIRHLLARRAAV